MVRRGSLPPDSMGGVLPADKGREDWALEPRAAAVSGALLRADAPALSVAASSGEGTPQPPTLIGELPAPPPPPLGGEPPPDGIPPVGLPPLEPPSFSFGKP